MFQTAINLTDTPRTEYNGWSDWTTWNCALWIGGDEGFYNMAKDCRDYGEFVDFVTEVYMNDVNGWGRLLQYESSVK